MKFIWFLVLFCGGIAVITYRERMQRLSGNFAFAEKWLGAGGTFTFYIFLGLGMIVFSVLYVTGTLDGFIEGTVGRFFFTPGN